jgi:cyclopropane fatty-acyl-phospholipid synthase-like methyltransferase
VKPDPRSKLDGTTSMPSSSKQNLYYLSGIDDVAEFYRTKFASDEVLDARYFKALDRFDIRFARTMWVYDNIRPGSNVLDLGCGAGMLALLKRKGVTLTGVDLSSECALAAHRNGYDATFSAELTQLPFGDGTFDYVVSLDVFGHIVPEEKDAVIREIRRVLRTDGVSLHGIECTDNSSRLRLEEMSEEERRRFVQIDGHVGLEEEQEHAQRFQKFFSHVEWEPRYALCLSSEEFLKQGDEYGLPFEKDFLNYLRGLSFKERRAFDMAMGYVFGKISELNIHLPKAGLYVLLKASNSPLGPFYNEHRDHKELIAGNANELNCLDRRNDVIFDDGWFEPNNLPPVARWMSGRARVTFSETSLSVLAFDVTTHMPNLRTPPLEIQVYLNQTLLASWSMMRHGWLHLHLIVPETIAAAAKGAFELEFRASRTWQPRPMTASSDERDDRELSIAVCNLEVFS